MARLYQFNRGRQIHTEQRCVCDSAAFICHTEKVSCLESLCVLCEETEILWIWRKWCHLIPAAFVVVDSDTKKTSNSALSSSGTLTGGTGDLTEGKGLCEMVTGSRQAILSGSVCLTAKKTSALLQHFGEWVLIKYSALTANEIIFSTHVQVTCLNF